MTRGLDYYQVEAYQVTMSQKPLRRFGSMLGSLEDEALGEIVRKRGDPYVRERIEVGSMEMIWSGNAGDIIEESQAADQARECVKSLIIQVLQELPDVKECYYLY